MRLISDSIKSTPTQWLPVLSNTPPHTYYVKGPSLIHGQHVHLLLNYNSSDNIAIEKMK